jgi:hypothetical protein
MKKIWSVIKENPDTIIAIVVGLIVTIWGVLGTNVNQQYLISAIAVILGVLAFSILRDRQARDSLVKEIQNLQQTLIGLQSRTVNAENFLLSRPKLGSLAERLKGTETLDMAGPSLLNISTSNQAILRDLKNSGAKVRLILSNPENINLQELLGLRHLEAESGAAHANFVRTSLTSLVPIIGDDIKGGSLQVRLTDQMQGFSYIGKNTNKPTGNIQIEFYMIKIALDRNPIMDIKAPSDPHWFEEFKSQFEYLWQNSLDLDISKYK